ncbi:LINE-1 reverse transcriptase homolog, partial [Linum perenne]
GDRNTKFFHKVANFNRKRNFIPSLTVHGVVHESEVSLDAVMVDFYSNLYSEGEVNRPFPLNVGFNTINQDCLKDLIKPFSELEVWDVIRMCAGDKAPGPDGFPMGYFKAHWNIVKSDILKALEDFGSFKTMPKLINNTFLYLIPKKEVCEDIKDLRPISLVSSFYKILAKVLSYRLRKVISQCISVNQCAFLEGRQILDASLIANEIIYSRRRSDKSGLVIKMDIEKAYDHVSWECLLRLMGDLGFLDKWIRWIHLCISSASFSVLVNEEAKGYFPSSRGLRQGDSLSSFLFIMVMELLSLFFVRARETNMIEGFFMNEDRRVGEVHHILYADDAVVFCDASIDQVQQVFAILICFEAVSGLKVNLHKSILFTVGEVENASDLANILGCALGSFPTSYLGLPLGTKAASRAVWDPVVEKVSGRLLSWKARFLSFGGCITLLKAYSARFRFTTFHFSKPPVSVIEDLKKIYNRFLWEVCSGDRKPHLVRWEVVKAPKSAGGLGVIDLRRLNSALLGKWGWRFASERDAWWRRLIVDKCEMGQSEWKPVWNLQNIGWSIWRDIVQNNPKFWEHASVDPGGGGVSFWFDSWVPGECLASRFPRIAAAAQSLDVPLFDSFVVVLDKYIWRFQLTTTLRGRAEEERRRMLRFLEEVDT